MLPINRTVRCECGCGRFTPVARKTNRKYQHVKGEPMRFVKGHYAQRPFVVSVPHAMPVTVDVAEERRASEERRYELAEQANRESAAREIQRYGMRAADLYARAKANPDRQQRIANANAARMQDAARLYNVLDDFMSRGRRPRIAVGRMLGDTR